MRRTLVLTLLVAVLALGIGVLITAALFPSDQRIERKSMEKLGLDPNLTDDPFLQELIDQAVGPVRGVVVDETRPGMLVGAAATIGLTVLGVGLILADHRRRLAEPATSAGSDAPGEAPATVPPPPPAPSASTTAVDVPAAVVDGATPAGARPRIPWSRRPTPPGASRDADATTPTEPVDAAP